MYPQPNAVLNCSKRCNEEKKEARYIGNGKTERAELAEFFADAMALVARSEDNLKFNLKI